MLNPIDIVLIVIVLLAALISAKKGFIWSVLNLGAILLSSVLSKLCAAPVSHFFYDQFLHTRIMGELNRLLPAGSVSGQIGESIESILNELPLPVTAIAKQYGLYPNLSGGTQVLTVEGIEQDYIVPIVTGVLTIIATVLLFVIFSAILKIVAGAINHNLSDKDKHRFVSRTNTLVGAVFGLLKGVLLGAVACILLNLVSPVLGNGTLSAMTEGSYFCGLIASLF